LIPIDARSTPDQPNRSTAAKYESVPYVDITGTKADLIAWCGNRSRATAGRLVHGPGGLGKTRLMIEIATTLRTEGWMAGFLDRPHEQVETTLKQRGQALDQLIVHANDRGLLIVMDYAERRQDEVRAVAKQLSRRAEGDHRQFVWCCWRTAPASGGPRCMTRRPRSRTCFAASRSGLMWRLVSSLGGPPAARSISRQRESVRPDTRRAGLRHPDN
jgi:hypothetical protein